MLLPIPVFLAPYNPDWPHIAAVHSARLFVLGYLRAQPDVASAYEKEKRRARDLHPNDSHAYTDEKAAWIQAAEKKALRWFNAQAAHT